MKPLSKVNAAIFFVSLVLFISFGFIIQSKKQELRFEQLSAQMDYVERLVNESQKGDSSFTALNKKVDKLLEAHNWAFNSR